MKTMIAAAHCNEVKLHGNAALGAQPEILTAIFEPEINIAIWQRDAQALAREASQLLIDRPHFSVQRVIDMRSTVICETQRVPLCIYPCLQADLDMLLDMFTTLTDAENVGVRIAVIDKAMCPRFHVDRVALRMVTTWLGHGTQWLKNNDVERSPAGRLRPALTAPGCLQKPGSPVQAARETDVTLLKGELWQGNSGNGIVHRSPEVDPGQRRLVVTIDAIYS